MNSSEEKAEILPMRLGPQSILRFRCHKNLKCFTKCCEGIDIVLAPYDIIRLKRRLNLSSQEFLAIYTEPRMLEKTDLPVVTLKLFENKNADGKKERPCPFVREDGCIIYEDRPATCRYYPLGVASLSCREDEEEDQFCFLIDEPHCLGFEEDKEWTVAEWRKDQGVDIDDGINAEWSDLLVRKGSFPQNVKLSEKSKNMFFMASYNIDKFREFVFESTFLSLYKIRKETVEEIQNDEVKLLKFGIRWLKSVLFKREDFVEEEFAIDEKKAAERLDIR